MEQWIDDFVLIPELENQSFGVRNENPYFFAFCLCLAFCFPIYADIIQAGPFKGVDLSAVTKETAETLRNANEDFLLILEGKPPKHAAIDKENPLLSDGGTTFYKGKNYKLTMIQSLSTFGGINGDLYGVRLEFDKGFAPGNMTTIESSRFYTFDEFKKFKPKS